MIAVRRSSDIAALPLMFFALALLLGTESPAAAGASRTAPRSFVGPYVVVAHDYVRGDEKSAGTERFIFRIEEFNRRTGRFTGTGTWPDNIFGWSTSALTGTVSGRRIDMRVPWQPFGRVDHERGKIRADGTIAGTLTADNGVMGTFVMTRGTGGTPWWRSIRGVIVSLLVLLALLLLGARLFGRRTPPRSWPPPPSPTSWPTSVRE
jgi:hypothetical protein